MEELIARIIARVQIEERYWPLYVPGVRKFLHEDGSVPMAPGMSIFRNVVDETVEIRIKVTPEWILEANQAQKLNAMFFFAEAWGAAIGLKSLE